MPSNASRKRHAKRNANLSKTMANAITITKWHANEAMRFYQELLQSKADEEYERIIQLIRREGGSITSRELQRKLAITEDVSTRMLNRYWSIQGMVTGGQSRHPDKAVGHPVFCA